ncbi:DGQHR domain-containing protein [Mesorhizobium sp. M1338]|uniref:DGQHR domain-containing protein n=1 Tax=Mesorhizobium sp. M1338 TaxID=2957085 RepID=UPI0033393EE7
MVEGLDAHVDTKVLEKRFKAVCVRQPIGDIYVASIDQASIQRMTYFDVRRRLQSERDVEKYLGIQRPLNERRVQELNEYVNFLDATFPSSIIISVASDFAWYDEKTSEIVFSNTRRGDTKPSTIFSNLCRVIDGQHRIAGLETSKQKNFDVIASIFIGSDIADQAYVFATVNLEQTKVNRSLAIDLFDLAKARSPYKTCHNVAVALDRTDGSPFKDRIKRLGVATEGRVGTETITQATFVDGLLRYISDDPKVDRDALLRNQKLQRPSAKELDRLVFRNLFLDDNDISIGKIYEQYFLAVQERWPLAWGALVLETYCLGRTDIEPWPPYSERFIAKSPRLASLRHRAHLGGISTWFLWIGTISIPTILNPARAEKASCAHSSSST